MKAIFVKCARALFRLASPERKRSDIVQKRRSLRVDLLSCLTSGKQKEVCALDESDISAEDLINAAVSVIDSRPEEAERLVPVLSKCFEVIEPKGIEFSMLLVHDFIFAGYLLRYEGGCLEEDREFFNLPRKESIYQEISVYTDHRNHVTPCYSTSEESTAILRAISEYRPTVEAAKKALDRARRLPIGERNTVISYCSKIFPFHLIVEMLTIDEISAIIHGKTDPLTFLNSCRKEALPEEFQSLRVNLMPLSTRTRSRRLIYRRLRELGLKPENFRVPDSFFWGPAEIAVVTEDISLLKDVLLEGSLSDEEISSLYKKAKRLKTDVCAEIIDLSTSGRERLSRRH